MNLIKRTIAVGALLASALGTGAAHAQNDAAGWLGRCKTQEEACEVRELGFRANGTTRLTVTGAGGAEVVGWDRDSVHVEARLQARGADMANSTEILKRVRVQASRGDIRADLDGAEAAWLVLFVVHVPRNSDLVLRANTGPLAVTGVKGDISAELNAGPLSLTHVGGHVHGRTGNGPVHVILDGRSWEGRGLDVATANGPMVLEIPEQYSAHLEAGTRSGPPIEMNERYLGAAPSTQWISGEVGLGGPSVRVYTKIGPATIRRYRTH
jgi:hypothetical protein